MRIPNLSQIESESLMKDQMKNIKGEGGGDVPTFCFSCCCPEEGKDLFDETYTAALKTDPTLDPD